MIRKKLKYMLLGVVAFMEIPVLGSGPDLHVVLETPGVQDEITEYSTFDDLCALAQTNKRLHKNVKSRWLWPFNFKTEVEFQESFNKMSLRFLPLSLTFHLPDRTPEILNMIPDTTRFSKRPYEKVLAAAHRGDQAYAKNWPDTDLDHFGRFAILFDKSVYPKTRMDALIDLKDIKFDEHFKKKQKTHLAVDFVFENHSCGDIPLKTALSFDLAARDLMKVWEKLKMKSVYSDLVSRFISQKLEDPLKTEVCKFYTHMINNTQEYLDCRLSAIKLISNLITAEEAAEYVKIFEQLISSNENIHYKLKIIEALSFLHLDVKTQNRLAHLVFSFELTPGMMELKALRAIRQFKFLNPHIKEKVADLSLATAGNSVLFFYDRAELLDIFRGFTNGERNGEAIRVLNEEKSIHNQPFVLNEILKFIPYDASIKQRYEEIVGHPDVVIWQKYNALAELLKAEKDMAFLNQVLLRYEDNLHLDVFDRFLKKLETLPKDILVDVYLKILETKNIWQYHSKTILKRLFKIDVDKKNKAFMIKVALENIENPESTVDTKLDFLAFLVKFDLSESVRAELTAACDQMELSEYEQRCMNNIRASLIP